jgi:ATP-dependent exoDNAse (exonuclease V) beta subunit
MGSVDMSAAGITIIGASAGSGKTYRLTQEVTSAVSSRSASRIDVAGLMAVTFTRKAHAELEARIRHKLVEEEAYDEALRLPLSYIGASSTSFESPTPTAAMSASSRASLASTSSSLTTLQLRPSRTSNVGTCWSCSKIGTERDPRS